MSRILVEIKLLASLKGLTLTYVAEELGKRLGKHYGLPNLSNKLKRGTINHEEVRLIADIFRLRDKNLLKRQAPVLLMNCFP